MRFRVSGSPITVTWSPLESAERKDEHGYDPSGSFEVVMKCTLDVLVSNRRK